MGLACSCFSRSLRCIYRSFTWCLSNSWHRHSFLQTSLLSRCTLYVLICCAVIFIHFQELFYCYFDFFCDPLFIQKHCIQSPFIWISGISWVVGFQLHSLMVRTDSWCDFNSLELGKANLRACQLVYPGEGSMNWWKECIVCICGMNFSINIDLVHLIQGKLYSFFVEFLYD